ncbi:MAG: prolipoprotein diacylglyceryl transferase [Spirochaetes bacterium]|nr:prolipoprotein diacylglyceryl transferase [Spirochaetota bacterium]
MRYQPKAGSRDPAFGWYTRLIHMHPILVELTLLNKKTVIGTYGVLMVAGLCAGIALSLFIARRYGYRPAEFINHCILGAAAILIGAYVAGFFVFLPERLGAEHIDYPPALVSWGGILGGLAALAVMKIRWKEPLLVVADIFTPGYLVGLGIGRIGCFFGGCCYGVHTASCIGVSFTDQAAPASALLQPLVPVQLISAAFLICAGLVLIPVALRNRRAGSAFAASAIAYAAFRFAIEFWRDDPRLFLLGFSDGQVFSVAYFLLGSGVMVFVIGRKGLSR